MMDRASTSQKVQKHVSIENRMPSCATAEQLFFQENQEGTRYDRPTATGSMPGLSIPQYLLRPAGRSSSPPPQYHDRYFETTGSLFAMDEETWERWRPAGKSNEINTEFVKKKE